MDIREHRTYEVLDNVQANLDEMDRRHQHYQMLMYLRYGEAAAIVILVLTLLGLWIWM